MSDKRWSVPYYLTVFCALFFSNIAYANEGGKHQLPRSYGSVTLGMTAKAFQKVAKVEVSSCVHCRKNEQYAYFYIDEKLAVHYREKPISIKGAHLKYQLSVLRPEAVHVFFYKGRLYSITMPGVQGTDKICKKSIR